MDIVQVASAALMTLLGATTLQGVLSLIASMKN